MYSLHFNATYTCRHSPQFLTWLTHLIFTWTSWRRFGYESHFTGDGKCMVIGTEWLVVYLRWSQEETQLDWDPSRLAPEPVSFTTALSCFLEVLSIIFRRKVTLTFVEESFHVTVSGSLSWSVCEGVSQVRWDRTKVEKYYLKEYFV